MKTRLFGLISCFSALFTLATLAGCSSDEKANPPTNPDASVGAGDSSTSTDWIPGDDTTVTGFDKQWISWVSGTDNRTADVNVKFPAANLTYDKVMLHLELACPAGGCDWYDRLGWLAIVKKGATPEQDVIVEISRFATPYRKAAKWDIDVTDLRPILSGDVTLRTFISTFVGPGSPNGTGWLVSTTFEMHGGIPEHVPVAVIPVWPATDAEYGNPDVPIEQSIRPQTIARPKDATQFQLRSFVTGHGQGNVSNCSEWCKKDHWFTVQQTQKKFTVWRDDCDTTAVPNQPSPSFKSPRAGWCPGSDMRAIVHNVTDAVGDAQQIAIGYGVEDYDNTCRPGVGTIPDGGAPEAGPDGGDAEAPKEVCTACTLGNTFCEYNGTNHTKARYTVSSVLIGYR